MAVLLIIHVIVVVLILLWLLKQKHGEKFSKGSIAKLLLLGAAVAVVLMVVSFIPHSPLKPHRFWGINPVLCGFATALLMAALPEEVLKYAAFRLGIFKNGEVVTWLDAIIAAVIVGMGFTLLEDVVFAVTSGVNIFRAILPAHLLFGALAGYFFGMARVKRSKAIGTLAVVVPVAWHTLFDMFLVGMESIVGVVGTDALNESMLNTLPYHSYLIPMLVFAIVIAAITFVAMVVMLVKIGLWSRKGEKQELLQ